MGASQGSSRNHAMARDAYRDPGNLQRGSRHTKSYGGSKSSNQQLVPSGGSSQQIVTYTGRQRHQRSESMGDLSMAFTYAVKHGGKLLNVDFSNASNTSTMIDFLNQIGRRSFEGANARNGTMSTSLVKHRASNGVVAPALSTIQIKEISKGVQNLYEIIRSSSNGTNVNRYSMEVGKELLKGAKGLEESLRMLVNLQEASEMMVKPQRKSRITLLEVDDEKEEDGRSKVVERNQVALPRFSFDKPSKRLNSSFSDGSSKFLTHQWSAAGDTAADAGSVRSVSYEKPTSEKGRISNVIAKLMGLEEVPVKVDSYPRRDEIKKTDDSRMNIVNTPSKPVKDSVIPQKVDQYPRLDSYSKRGEVVKNEDVYKNTVKKTSRASNERKSQQFHDLNTNGESRVTQINKNNRADRVSQKQERQSNGEAKEKTHSKRRSLEVVEKSQAEKKKATRTEKSSEIKLVPRSNHIQEPERRVQKSKQDSQQMKPIKNTNSASKELKPQPVEGNQKLKVSTPKAQDQEPAQQKMVPVARKKVDARAVARIESPRTKEEALRRRKRTINNLPTPLKHKLSVLKETNRNEVHICSEPEEVKTIKANSISNAKETESTTPSYDIVPICENETKITTEIKRDPQITNEAKIVPQITSEIIVSGTNAGILGKTNLLENKPKKASYSSIQVALTEQEKQLKEIFIKDQLFLSTAEALFKLNIPVGFLHVEDHSHHDNETKLKLDCGYEILKRKARSQELCVHPYVKPSIGSASITYLDELVKQLYKDLEGVRLYGRDMRNKFDETDYLHHMLEKDIHNKNPDINSFWDFGWHITTFTFVEKDEFVCDVEQDMVCRLVDEIVDDLLSM
ncbi:hypothetical protein M8C21_003404 [Ambrosia artemisiifolia]|uniref:DUF3741 domain-containing protein n=1 Tax=Ambrosia artemisiifolia TaxID=4212 RepID=A0AAD5GBL1_AMBAR|nr:hypothetical protein M8C21_003404 [Ambrosia artemisiifolia]